MASWPKLNRGDLVVAIKDLDKMGVTTAKPGMLGVVFEEAEYHEPNTGPMVRFMNGGVCNVYEGWVEKVRG